MKGKAFEIVSVILLFDALVVATVLLFSAYVPDGSPLRFMKWETLLNLGKVNQNLMADSLINKYEDEDSVSVSAQFSLKKLEELKRKKGESFIFNPDTLGSSYLDSFFVALGDSLHPKSLRIAHYGDSQLEGDRVSCFIRKKFQQKFGGYGLGFVPLCDIATSVDYSIASSDNWIRYTVFHNRYKGGYYGLSGTVFRFSKYIIDHSEEKDTTVNQTIYDSSSKSGKIVAFHNAWVSYHFQTSYKTITLMYGNAKTPCLINVYDTKTSEIILRDTLAASFEFNLHELKLPTNPLAIKIEFISGISPDFYGLLFDGDKGVQVDNYAIRGHSGDGLMNIQPDFLAKQIQDLHTKLVLFQYGANVVPYIKNEKDCKNLEQIYYKLFMRYKAKAPETSVLVIGAGDMARSIDGKYESYPMLSEIRDAQKRAALKAGCAFWDLYEIMGGEDAILTWTEKGLASYDGHLTPKGQKMISEKLFNALMVEYNLYLFRKKHNS